MHKGANLYLSHIVINDQLLSLALGLTVPKSIFSPWINWEIWMQHTKIITQNVISKSTLLVATVLLAYISKLWTLILDLCHCFKWAFSLKVNWIMKGKLVASYRVGYVIWATLTHTAMWLFCKILLAHHRHLPVKLELSDGVVIVKSNKFSLAGSLKCCNTTQIIQQVIQIEVRHNFE